LVIHFIFDAAKLMYFPETSKIKRYHPI